MTESEMVKVYELAKELGLDSISLLDKLNGLNIKVKSHMSELSTDEARLARESLSKKAAATAAPKKKATTTRKKPVAAASTDEAPAKAATKTAAKTAAPKAAPVAEEPAKAAASS